MIFFANHRKNLCEFALQAQFALDLDALVDALLLNALVWPATLDLDALLIVMHKASNQTFQFVKHKGPNLSCSFRSCKNFLYEDWSTFFCIQNTHTNESEISNTTSPALSN